MNKLNFTISIALTTYNGELYLREQLDSILDQSIPFDEIIISDDASIDNTWDILKEYEQKDCRIKISRNEENIGFIKNFEKSIKLCTGDLIALSDQDDIWHPDHLKILFEGLKNKICTVGDAELIDSTGNCSGYKLSYCENLDYIPKDDLSKAYFIFYCRNPYQGASMMFRKFFLNIALPIPEGVKYHDTWFASLACFYGGFQPLKEVVTYYRRHSNAVSGAKVRSSRWRIFLSHLVYAQTNSYRPLIASAIEERIKELSNDQTIFLKQVKKYFKRTENFCGRLANIEFELNNFKLIYGYK